ncbi:hypothetical protein AAVH_07219, partial [Aphelenchoides avenae]
MSDARASHAFLDDTLDSERGRPIRKTRNTSAFPILEGASRAPHEPADGPRLWKCRLRERHDGALPGAGALGQHHECVDGVVHFVFFFAER